MFYRLISCNAQEAVSITYKDIKSVIKFMIISFEKFFLKFLIKKFHGRCPKEGFIRTAICFFKSQFFT